MEIDRRLKLLCGLWLGPALGLGIWGMIEVYSNAQPDNGPVCAKLHDTLLWTMSAITCWLQIVSASLPCLVLACIVAAQSYPRAGGEEAPHKNLALTALRRASRLHGSGSFRRLSLAATNKAKEDEAANDAAEAANAGGGSTASADQVEIEIDTVHPQPIEREVTLTPTSAGLVLDHQLSHT